MKTWIVMLNDGSKLEVSADLIQDERYGDKEHLLVRFYNYPEILLGEKTKEKPGNVLIAVFIGVKYTTLIK